MKTIARMALATIAAIGLVQQPAGLAAAEMMAQAAPAPMADGEIRKVDKDAKKLTIKHGPIGSLDMPAMTMVFAVKDPAMLDTVKTGDKVKFEVEKAGGAFTVTKIVPAP